MSVIRLIDRKGERGSADDYTPLVRIYVDGSCVRNGAIDSSAGCGAVMLDQNRLEIRLVAKYLGQITNQQAEILAGAKALEQLRRPCRVEIISDSKYVIDTMTGRNRMRTNRPFWTRLVEECYGHHITWRWVKGHSGVPFQEVADRLARASARVCSDFAVEDLEQLSGHLSDRSEQFDIREFEIELEKVSSRASTVHQSFIPTSKFDGIGTLPSAFSA
ncbi:MAG: RNase H family protein [Pyrinomonadaceae bacterium]